MTAVGATPGSDSGARERVQIRAAVPGDWPQIWTIVREVIAAGQTYALPEDLTSDQGQREWMAAPWQVLVAESGDRIVGSAKFGPNRPGRGDHVATASFMIGSAARGLGIGRLLGQRVLDDARAAGFTAMQFNAVVETNVAAVNLWRSLGFTVIGTVPEAFRSATDGLVGLHVMHRSLN